MQDETSEHGILHCGQVFVLIAFWFRHALHTVCMLSHMIRGSLADPGVGQYNCMQTGHLQSEASHVASSCICSAEVWFAPRAI